MPLCPACPSPVSAGATKCEACGAPFAEPRYGIFESRLTPEQETSLQVPRALRIFLGLTGIGGGAWGLMAVAANWPGVEPIGIPPLILMVAMFCFGGYCGVLALSRKPGWVRMNQVLWSLQIPTFASPVLSYGFATGGFMTVWLQIYPPVRVGWNAWLGSSFTLNLLTPGPLTIGVNLVALAVVVRLMRLQRSAEQRHSGA